ncbi:MAG TPA: hypothetical protein VGD04_10280 [Methylophilus sp.]
MNTAKFKSSIALKPSDVKAPAPDMLVEALRKAKQKLNSAAMAHPRATEYLVGEAEEIISNALTSYEQGKV